jgi:alkylation response protein AidB-like acyl-CoA dehydrogenase
VDLALVAYEFGRHAAPGPLVATNVVASALSTHDAHADVVASLLSGEGIATWCFPEPGQAPGGWRPAVEVDRDGATLVVRGEARPVESAVQAGQFLVTARDGNRTTQVLVPASADGVSVAPMQTVDLTRRFGAVTFHDVRLSTEALVGEAGEARSDVEHQLRQALALLNAEAVGAMQAAFDMTVEWAFDRYSFGRPLASYQALKHRYADMLTWLEASHAISDAALLATQEDAADADELTSAAKAFIGEYGAELVQDCVQMHGGIGITFEHDLHLFLRRFTINRSLVGTPADHRQRVATILNEQGGEAA